MNKMMLYVCAAAVAVSTAFPKDKKHPIQEPTTEVKQVIPLTELSPQMTRELIEGSHPDIAIECKQGTQLAFKYSGNYELLSVHFAPNLTIKVEKNAYIRFIRTRADKPKSLRGYISYDLKKWDKIDGNLLGGKPELNIGISKDKSSILLETVIKPAIDEGKNKL
ncbi:MAG: hypothetical protein JSS10_00460 [Verrucomicrobia bacterium]|nr:hypothetical protein [Verrucomicrobiota bacterium]